MNWVGFGLGRNWDCAGHCYFMLRGFGPHALHRLFSCRYLAGIVHSLLAVYTHSSTVHMALQDLLPPGASPSMAQDNMSSSLQTD